MEARFTSLNDVAKGTGDMLGELKLQDLERSVLEPAKLFLVDVAGFLNKD